MCLCGNVSKIIDERNKLIEKHGKFKDWPEEVKQVFFEFRRINGKGCIAGN